MNASSPGYEQVEFSSHGVTLRGRLYHGSDGPRGPAVVMAPGFSATVSAMVADCYAEAFADAGLLVLLFDNPGFGASDGEPRHEIEPWGQSRAYLAAVAFMRSRDDVDPERIALWGASSSAARATVAASIDERVAALVMQVPALGDSMPPPRVNEAAFSQIRETILDAEFDGYERTVTGPMAVVSPDQSVVPSLLRPITAFRWFIHFGARFETGWENRASFADLAAPQPLDPKLCAPFVSAPTLAVLAEHDEMHGASADIARSVLETVQGSTEIVTVDGGHFGVLYPDSQAFGQSIEAQRNFLLRHLC